MRIVFNRIIPFKGYYAMCLWPFVFVRKEIQSRYGEVTENHERIHGEQQKELLVLPFLLWYGAEWLVGLIRYRNASKAYRSISFEQEAYINQYDLEYLKGRRRFSWAKYVFK